MELLINESRFQKSADLTVAWCIFGVFITIIIGTAVYLWIKYPELHNKNMLDRIGVMYPNLPTKRDRLYVMRFPLLLLHRLFYVLVAFSLSNRVTLSIQLLLI